MSVDLELYIAISKKRRLIDFIFTENVRHLLPFGKFDNVDDLGEWYLVLAESTTKKWNLDRIEQE